MENALVIVESPAKGKTIQNYLGSGYTVVASFGHIRDLPKHELGVDIEHNFTPTYVIPSKARKTVAVLKKDIQKAAVVYLATDLDREGEAIAWHIVQACGLGNNKSQISNTKKVYRIIFHEITKPALQKAIKNPRDINQKLVDAQQARRVLDRLVGYKLSPFLWKKVYKGLSAGRVQSVAVRLIVDREREINAFKQQEYWSIEAEFKTDAGTFQASLNSFDNKPLEKLAIKNEAAVQKLLEAIKQDDYAIASIETKTESKHPLSPYTTSTLQQDANHRLAFSSKQTMKLAQDLYEAGLITYMRTDSTSVSALAINALRKWISAQQGEKYLSSTAKIYKTKTKGAQEAHEAIRVTHCEKEPSNLAKTWSPQHLKLYDLIWRRYVASQMEQAQVDRTTILVNGHKNHSVFQATGQRLAFDGFLKVYSMSLEEKTLPAVKKDAFCQLVQAKPEQHFTQPPARFTEASLVKALEEQGIGRPSTYVPTIATIIDRGYVRVESRVLFPQEVGLLVTDLLKEHFPNIVDVTFTAKMEAEFDDIAEGKEAWTKPIAEFWGPFDKLLTQKMKDVEKVEVTKELDEKCPKCKKPLLERLGKFGKFISCSGFPECKYTRSYVEETGFKCPDCKEGDVVALHSRKGREFFGCSNYPKCKYMTWDDPRKEKNSKDQITNNK